MFFPKETLREPIDLRPEPVLVLGMGGFDKIPASFTRMPTSSTGSLD